MNCMTLIGNQIADIISLDEVIGLDLNQYACPYKKEKISIQRQAQREDDVNRYIEKMDIYKPRRET